jgi:hypothetical protein
MKIMTVCEVYKVCTLNIKFGAVEFISGSRASSRYGFVYIAVLPVWLRLQLHSNDFN